MEKGAVSRQSRHIDHKVVPSTHRVHILTADGPGFGSKSETNTNQKCQFSLGKTMNSANRTKIGQQKQ